MTSIGGPKESKEKLLATIVQTTILYAAPIWRNALKYQKCNSIVPPIQKKMNNIVRTIPLHFWHNRESLKQIGI